MSGDSTVENITGSSGTTPTESPPSSEPSAESKSDPASNRYFPPAPMRRSRRAEAMTTTPPKGSLEAKNQTLLARVEREKLREALAGYVNPWKTTISETRKVIQEMVAAPETPRSQRLVAKVTLAVLRDKDATAAMKVAQVNQLARMLGAFNTEDPADKMKRLLDEDLERRNAIPTEALIAGAKTNGTG